MKKRVVLIILLMTLLSTTVFSGDCVDKNGKDIFDNSELFQKLIAESRSCYNASQLATACSYGSSVDLVTVELAFDICEVEFKKNQPKKTLVELFELMSSQCSSRYDAEPSPIFRTMNAYCHLNALTWVLPLSR